MLCGCGLILVLLAGSAALLWYVVLPRTGWLGMVKQPDEAARNTAKPESRPGPGAATEENGPGASPTPRPRTTTLIGVLKLNDSGDMVIAVPANPYSGDSTEMVYLLEDDPRARRLLESAGGAAVRIMLVGQVTGSDTPPRIRLKSIRQFAPEE